MSEPKQQKRGKKIAMTADEINAFLSERKICRVGTIKGSGQPHVTALFFAWDGQSIWLYSITGSQRWKNLINDPRVSILVDSGEEYFELRGVEMSGEVEQVGEIPRVGEKADGLEGLEAVEKIYAEKYNKSDEMTYDGKHAWLRLTPKKIVSWDFTKLPAPNE